MKRIKFRSHWGSHLPVLIKLTSITTGPILELGSGMYSTPYLHWECYRTGRRLVTYEMVREFYDIAKSYENSFHKVVHVKDWDLVDFSGDWSVAFVDHEPGNRRGKDALRVGHADYVIAHDAMKSELFKYGYDDAFDKFKYQFRYRGARPWTMVLSNKFDLKNFTVKP